MLKNVQMVNMKNPQQTPAKNALELAELVPENQITNVILVILENSYKEQLVLRNVQMEGTEKLMITHAKIVMVLAQLAPNLPLQTVIVVLEHYSTIIPHVSILVLQESGVT